MREGSGLSGRLTGRLWGAERGVAGRADVGRDNF
jgi:hypothetical protein